MNYKTIKDIAGNLFYDESVELNDVIIPKSSSQYGKCYVSKNIITNDNIDFIYIKNDIMNKDGYQNIKIVDKNVKKQLLRECLV